MELSSLVTTIALEMVVPILLGYWIDRWLGFSALFAILGGIAGLTGGVWHLVRLAAILSRQPGKKHQHHDDGS